MQEEVSEIRSRQCPLWFAETSLSDAPQTLGEGPQAGCWCGSLASLFHSLLGRGLMAVACKEEQDAQVAAKWWECYWMTKKSLFLNGRNCMLSVSMKGLQVESSLNLIKHALFYLPKVPFYPSSWAQGEERAGAGNSLLLNTRTCDRASPCSAWNSLSCTCFS